MGIQDALRNHPAVGGLVSGVALGVAGSSIVNIIRTRSSKKRKVTSTKKKKSTSSTRKASSKTRTSVKKRGKVNTKKIYTTKTGQPYIKKANGQARFISKKSAKLRKKRKGGYY